MRKLKMFTDYDDEEKWLSEMSIAGWKLVNKNFFYKFEKNDEENINYAVDFQDYMSRADYINYITMFEDFGWKHIAGSRFGGEQYFVNESDERGDSIFSDRESSAKRYRKKGIQSLISAITFMILYLITIPNNNFGYILNPKSAFLTPGLWERTGGAFWGAFLFELPFAALRFISIVFIVIYIIRSTVYGFWYLKLEKYKNK